MSHRGQRRGTSVVASDVFNVSTLISGCAGCPAESGDGDGSTPQPPTSTNPAADPPSLATPVINIRRLSRSRTPCTCIQPQIVTPSYASGIRKSMYVRAAEHCRGRAGSPSCLAAAVHLNPASRSGAVPQYRGRTPGLEVCGWRHSVRRARQPRRHLRSTRMHVPTGAGLSAKELSLANCALLLQLFSGAVDIVRSLFDFHVVILGRLLEVIQDDITRLVAIVGLATTATQTHRTHSPPLCGYTAARSTPRAST
jgi:hypothetical protein